MALSDSGNDVAVGGTGVLVSVGIIVGASVGSGIMVAVVSGTDVDVAGGVVVDVAVADALDVGFGDGVLVGRGVRVGRGVSGAEAVADAVEGAVAEAVMLAVALAVGSTADLSGAPNEVATFAVAAGRFPTWVDVEVGAEGVRSQANDGVAVAVEAGEVLVFDGATTEAVLRGFGVSSLRTAGVGIKVGMGATSSMLLEIRAAETGRLASPLPSVVVLVTGSRTYMIAAASPITTSAATIAVSVEPFWFLGRRCALSFTAPVPPQGLRNVARSDRFRPAAGSARSVVFHNYELG